LAAALEGTVSFDATTSRPDSPPATEDGGGTAAAWAGPRNGGRSREQMASRPPVWGDECVATAVVSQPKLWAPDTPYLYDLKITLFQDLPSLPGTASQTVALDEVTR
jgi:hypothetical protein